MKVLSQIVGHYKFHKLFHQLQKSSNFIIVSRYSYSVRMKSVTNAIRLYKMMEEKPCKWHTNDTNRGLSNVDASQSFFTGGGTGVCTVAIATSPMIRNASLQAWYILIISSRFRASSGLSSIIVFCTKYGTFNERHSFRRNEN